MGFIREALNAGYPCELLVPVEPGGKKPAVWDGNLVKWVGYEGWTRGTTLRELESLDDLGANCGLMCGKSPLGSAYYLVDLDVQLLPVLDPKLTEEQRIEKSLFNANRLCQATERLFARFLNTETFYLRKTWSYRSMILLESKSNQLGRKAVNTFMTAKGLVVMKIEILGHGQQGVIAGVHKAGPITWQHYGDPNILPYTVLPTHQIQSVESYGVILSVLEGVTESIEKNGFKAIRKPEGRTVSERTDDKPYSPPRQAIPPGGPKQLMLALACAYNGPDIDRDIWMNMMMAVSGSIRAMRFANMITEQEVMDIRDEACRWAVKWGPQTSLEAEIEKFETDWLTRDVRFTGWWRVVEIMMAHLKGEEFIDLLQTHDFDNMEIPEGANAKEIIRDIIGGNDPEVVAKPPKVLKLHIPTADLALADATEASLGSRMRFVIEYQSWMVWNEGKGWTRSGAGAQVQRWIQKQSADYVAKMIKTEQWTQATCAKLLSQSRFDAVDKILRNRLSISALGVDSASYVLQCPDGAYDLRTLQRLHPDAQRELMDSRQTSVSPIKGATPLFDSLLMHLSNHDNETFQYLLAVLGYAALGAPLEHIFVVLHGPGGNGKSTLLRVISEVMGDYAKGIDRDVILALGKQQHKTSLFEVKGRRYALVSEIPPNEKWNEGRLKALTGLDDVEANRMHRDPITFRPEAVWFLASQYVPAFSKVDNSVVRRIRIAGTFTTPEVPILNLTERIIAEEGPMLLYRIMQIANRVFEAGKLPPVPLAMAAITDRYLNEQDKFFAWFRAECGVGPDTKENTHPLTTVMSKYKEYQERHRDPNQENDALSALDTDMSAADFVKNLRRLGVQVESFKIGKRTDQICKCLRMRIVPHSAGARIIPTGNVVMLRPESPEIIDLMQELEAKEPANE